MEFISDSAKVAKNLRLGVSHGPRAKPNIMILLKNIGVK